MSDQITVSFIETNGTRSVQVNSNTSLADAALAAGIGTDGSLQFNLNGANVSGAETLDADSRVIATRKVEGGA